MEYAFTYYIVTGICFSDLEFEFLTKSITQHKQTVYAVKQGYFWHGNIIRRQECIPGLRNKCPVTASIKQLENVLLQSLETYVLHGHEDQKERDFAIDLYYKLYKIAEDALNETQILNDSGNTYRISGN